MRELKISESMEIHYTTAIENHSFAHGLGLERRSMEIVKSFDVCVLTKKGDWVSITHALPESFYHWCFEQCENDLFENSEVA